MRVILTKEILGLGDPGDVVLVKNGYGRNYLVPKRMAIIATKKNIATVTAEQTRLVAQQAREAERVKDEAASLSGVTVTIMARVGKAGRLYGSVTNIDVALALVKVGLEIDRRRILLKAPIKQVGIYNVNVKLRPQVIVDIKVVVKAQLEEQLTEE